MISKEKQKYIRLLHSKKGRQSESKFLVEGGKNIEELLQSDFKVSFLYLTEKCVLKYGEKLKNREYIICSEKDIQKSTSLSSNDMGIAIVECKDQKLPDDFTDELILVLDTINDPGNLGTIIRIADWYGIKNIFCSHETVDFYSPKVISSTMGSFGRVNIIKTDLVDFLSTYKNTIYGAYLDGKSIHDSTFDNTGCIVIGNESHGISESLGQYITKKITIPRFGGAESLNAGVATAIILDNFKR
ncbi:MAG: RNA methyltransferase [Candidatus Gracilibacteria bacterium]|nr:RNA methyltransferase [Candidatus Gracilibacteria bacterium]